MQKQRRRCGCSVVVVASIMLTVNSIGEAQQQQVPSTPMSMAQAVESALRNYPAISVSQEQVNAAAAGIDLARTSYLRRVDSLAHVNRSTANYLVGLLVRQGVHT